MTSIATVANIHARPAFGSGEVSSVRAPRRVVDGETARRQNAELAAKSRDERPRSHTQASSGAAANVVDLPIADEGQAQLAPPARQARPFVPFLAQQIAQNDLPVGLSRTNRADTPEAVTQAYVLASDDAVNILGPVRPRQLIV